ncbi:uncharacterized protein LOC129869823 [Solanum dulcamara]|uniref:uncharacterized protein LOC129869823 n=1 Tax=Solanum dulcamara TaxID=45834 RepID=UPI0024866E4D|nr:uncharacterized protein LOC129869823 [Solanum dulcamara]
MVLLIWICRQYTSLKKLKSANFFRISRLTFPSIRSSCNFLGFADAGSRNPRSAVTPIQGSRVHGICISWMKVFLLVLQLVGVTLQLLVPSCSFSLVNLLVKTAPLVIVLGICTEKQPEAIPHVGPRDAEMQTAFLKLLLLDMLYLCFCFVKEPAALDVLHFPAIPNTCKLQPIS